MSPKRIRSLAMFAAIAIFAGCSGGDTSAGSDSGQRASPADQEFLLADFEAVGFKKLKVYDTEGLPGAASASFGFWRAPGEEPRNYELRFYASHEEAVRDGTALAEEVTGEDAVLFVDDLTWKEGARDRRHMALLRGAGGELVPKYLDYMIYGNVVMLCEGAHPEQSRASCAAMITALLAHAEPAGGGS